MKYLSILLLPVLLFLSSCGSNESFKGLTYMKNLELKNGRFVNGLNIIYEWTKGDFKGAKYDIEYNPDGTLVWKGLEGWEKGDSNREKNYYARKIDEGIYATSMLEESFWTVTLIINTKTNKIYGYASNEKELYKPEGILEKIQ